MALLDPRRIPVIGSEIYQVGQVYDIISQPCNPDPVIAVKAFFNYAPLLLWSAVAPDCTDLISAKFGGKHHRKRKAKFHLFGTVAHKVPRQGSVGWFVTRGAFLAERIGWHFLIVDATTDFLVNWTSATYQFSGCTDLDAPYGDISRTTNSVHNNAGGWFQVGNATVQNNHIWTTSSSGVHANTTGPKSATLSIDFYKPSGPVIAEVEDVEIRFVYPLRTETVKAAKHNRAGDDNTAWTTAEQIYNPLNEACFIQVWVKATAGFVGIGSWFLSTAGGQAHGLDPSWCGTPIGDQ